MEQKTRRIAVIGDVHGCINTLKALIAQLPIDAEVCMVGDLIDRGPGSAEVIEFVHSKGYLCVTGNHEDMMLSSLRPSMGKFDVNYFALRDWIYNGGGEALSSYNLTNYDYDAYDHSVQLKNHTSWLSNLPTFIEFPDVKNKDGRYLTVSHSSMHEVWDDRHEKMNQYGKSIKDIIMWNRFIIKKDIPGVYNIFGHTPIEEAKITDHYANVDTGAVYKNIEGGGVLTALMFPDMIVYTQNNID